MRAFCPVTLLNRDFNTGVFLWLFLEHLFWRTCEHITVGYSSNCCSNSTFEKQYSKGILKINISVRKPEEIFKKKTPAQVFSSEFCEILRTSIWNFNICKRLLLSVSNLSPISMYRYISRHIFVIWWKHDYLWNYYINFRKSQELKYPTKIILERLLKLKRSIEKNYCIYFFFIFFLFIF